MAPSQGHLSPSGKGCSGNVGIETLFEWQNVGHQQRDKGRREGESKEGESREG